MYNKFMKFPCNLQKVLKHGKQISSNEPSLVSGQDEFNFLEILNLNSLQEINQNNNINKKKKMN